MYSNIRLFFSYLIVIICVAVPFVGMAALIALISTKEKEIVQQEGKVAHVYNKNSIRVVKSHPIYWYRESQWIMERLDIYEGIGKETRMSIYGRKFTTLNANQENEYWLLLEAKSRIKNEREFERSNPYPVRRDSTIANPFTRKKCTTYNIWYAESIPDVLFFTTSGDTIRYHCDKALKSVVQFDLSLSRVRLYAYYPCSKNSLLRLTEDDICSAAMDWELPCTYPVMTTTITAGQRAMLKKAFYLVEDKLNHYK